eukprot:scaffold438016_cov52-Prasinocladus_malaysianus.AAC.1
MSDPSLCRQVFELLYPRLSTSDVARLRLVSRTFAQSLGSNRYTPLINSPPDYYEYDARTPYNRTAAATVAGRELEGVSSSLSDGPEKATGRRTWASW